MGQQVDATAVLVRYTRYGDADLSGTVGLDDFNRLASNFNTTGQVWTGGDFNYDGNVNLDDFNLLAGNFNLSAGPDGVVDPEDWSALPCRRRAAPIDQYSRNAPWAACESTYSR